MGKSNSQKKKSKAYKKRQQNKKAIAQLSPYLKDPTNCPMVQNAREYFSGMKFKVFLDSVKGWRTISKLAVRPQLDDPCKVDIGLFKPGTHSVVVDPECIAHHPSINAAVHVVTKACSECKVPAYSEHTDSGLLRYISCIVSTQTGKLSLTLIWNAGKEARKPNEQNSSKTGKEQHNSENLLAKLKSYLIKNQGDTVYGKFQLHNLFVHYNSLNKHSNAIMNIHEPGDECWRKLYGDKFIYENISNKITPLPYDITLCFSPMVFRQANLGGFSAIIKNIRDYLLPLSREKNLRCVELYGGVGTIGFHLFDLFSTFVSSDANPHNVACFEKAKSLLPHDAGRNISYEAYDATEMVKKNKLVKADIIIVDPPRKGLDSEVVSAFSNLQTKNVKLIYVSCGFRALKRDLTELRNCGWKLVRAEGHILFPGADHVETLCFLER